jgi:pyruvate-formate lyase-activating enzyme
MTTAIAATRAPEDQFPFLREHPEYDSPAKRRNVERLSEARDEGRLILSAAPAYIRLEPSAHCNLRCCWAQRNPKHPRLRPRGHADPDLARRIVGEIGQTLYQAILCHWGEPTLNPHLPEIVQVFHDAGVYTTFDTNMTLMTEALAAGLVEAGLDAISASIDGVSQDSYGQYRLGGKVDTALAGLRHVVDQRRRLGRSNPRIRWQFLVFPHNEDEVGAARRIAEEIGVDTFEAFGAGGRRWTPEGGFEPPQPPARSEGLLCEDPWHYLAIDWDGAVHLCCRAFQARHVAGHMGDRPLAAIFDNDRFQLARRVIRDGIWEERDGPNPCTGCNKVRLFVPAIAQLDHGLGLEDQ